MDVILIPGFWLGGDSWDEVAPAIRAAGHTVHALTLPGLSSVDDDRSGITLRDHVDAVVAAIDELGQPVALVGHSGGGPIAYAASDVRAAQVRRVVYVDAGPLPVGAPINAELPEVGGEIPLPDWSAFTEADLADLTDELRVQFRARSVPEPTRVATDPQRAFTDDRRLAIRSTLVCSSFPVEQFRQMITAGHPYTRELAHLTDYELVELTTGHWPQFTKPVELGAAIVAALA